MKAARLQPLYIAGRCSRACYKQHTITSFFIFLYRFLPRLKATQNRSCCTSDPLSWFASVFFQWERMGGDSFHEYKDASG